MCLILVIDMMEREQEKEPGMLPGGKYKQCLLVLTLASTQNKCNPLVLETWLNVAMIYFYLSHRSSLNFLSCSQSLFLWVGDKSKSSKEICSYFAFL